MLKRLLIIILILSLILIITACDGIIGEDVDTIAKENNIRIVSLSSNQTEILIALGLEDNIIGLNSFDDFIRSDIDIVGDISGLDMARIADLNPDLIIDYNDEFINDFKKSSMEYISFSPNSIKSIKDNIIDIGNHTNTEGQAAEIVKDIDEQIESIISSSPIDTRNIGLEVWHDPLTYVNEDSYMDELIGVLNGRLCENTSEMDVYIAYDNIPERAESNEILLLDPDYTIPGMKLVEALSRLLDMIK